MKSLVIRRAKAHLSALARAAAAGEPTLITDYGKPIAMIASVVENPAQDEAIPAPMERPKPRIGAAAFRHVLFDAPHPLELDFDGIGTENPHDHLGDRHSLIEGRRIDEGDERPQLA